MTLSDLTRAQISKTFKRKKMRFKNNKKKQVKYTHTAQPQLTNPPPV
jgi:hypothetical protein